MKADDAFVARLKSSDPSVSEYGYGAESYDLTIASALAATPLSFRTGKFDGFCPGATGAAYGTPTATGGTATVRHGSEPAAG